MERLGLIHFYPSTAVEAELGVWTGLEGRPGHPKPVTPRGSDTGLSFLPILQQSCGF